jgi:hypothetical protein
VMTGPKGAAAEEVAAVTQTAPQLGRLQALAREIRSAGLSPQSRNRRVIAVGEDSAGKLHVGSSNGLDPGQRAAAARMGISPVKSIRWLHAEEELLRAISDLKRIGTSRRGPCGAGEHDCAGKLGARGVEIDNR